MRSVVETLDILDNYFYLKFFTRHVFIVIGNSFKVKNKANETCDSVDQWIIMITVMIITWNSMISYD